MKKSKVAKNPKNAGRKKTLPDEGFVRLPKILEVFPVSRSTWLEGVRTGRFPKGVMLGPRVKAWTVKSIRELLDSIK